MISDSQRRKQKQSGIILENWKRKKRILRVDQWNFIYFRRKIIYSKEGNFGSMKENLGWIEVFF